MVEQTYKVDEAEEEVWVAVRDRDDGEVWKVRGFAAGGVRYLVVFHPPNAAQQVREYAAWKNGLAQNPSQSPVKIENRPQ